MKIPIARIEDEIVLNRERCYPHIIRGNRLAPTPQRAVNGYIVVDRRLIRRQQMNVGPAEKLCKSFLILIPFGSESKTPAQFGKNDQGYPYLTRRFKSSDNIWHSLCEIGVPV
ncbi:MAG: hypothetical protein WD851_04335 [Pirellulales bacterium]